MKEKRRSRLKIICGILHALLVTVGPKTVSQRAPSPPFFPCPLTLDSG